MPCALFLLCHFCRRFIHEKNSKTNNSSKTREDAHAGWCRAPVTASLFVPPPLSIAGGHERDTHKMGLVGKKMKGEIQMLSRNQLLEAVNSLNHAHSGRQVGYINGYRDQWFLGCSIHLDEPLRKVLEIHFCQGRSTGRINSNGGYPVELEVTHCESVQDIFREFELLDHHKRREKERAAILQARLEARCVHCVNYIGRLTGNCVPFRSCNYKRVRRKHNKSMIQFSEKGCGNGISGPQTA